MSDNPQITIVGGGLSAIYAYWGCLDAGYTVHDIQVLRKDTGVAGGAIFMYETPIPWPSTKVTSILFGTCDQYAINQWGIICETSVNKRFANGKRDEIMEYMVIPDEILPTLWGMIPHLAECPTLQQEDFDRLKRNRKAVICCFANQEEKKKRQKEGFLTFFPVYNNYAFHSECSVIYNGLPYIPWIRQTMFPNKIFVEYASGTNHNQIMNYEHNRGNKDGLIRMLPDILPDCPPLTVEERTEDNLFRVGRYAAFQPGYLSYQVRDEVSKFLGGL